MGDNWKIVDVENGLLVFESNGYKYISGETVHDFGEENLTTEERDIVMAKIGGQHEHT